MTRIQTIGIALLIASFAILGCDEGEQKCHRIYCEDNWTLRTCDLETGVASHMDCPNGCVDGKCIERQGIRCRSNQCLDIKTLYKCDTETGLYSAQNCPSGFCRDGQCLGDKCTSNECKDSKTLLKCDLESGGTMEEACSNGCNAGACLP